MKKYISLLILFTYTAAIAGDAVIWNGQYGKFLPSLGFRLSDLKEYRTISVDPSAGAGVAAPIGSVAVRDNAGVGEAWFKAGAADTVWTNILTGLTGWSLTGNTGTNDAVNFLGTTDAQDLVVKTNNTTRMTITDTGQIDLIPNQITTSGAIGAVAASHTELQMSQSYSTIGNAYNGINVAPVFNDAITSNANILTLSDTWANGSTVPSSLGMYIGPQYQAGSSVTSYYSPLSINPNFAAATLVGANYNGVSQTPTLSSNFLGYQAYTDQPTISGAMTNGYGGFNSTPQFGAASSMPSNFKGLNVQPNISAGATFTSGIGAFVSANIASGVTINDWTDFQSSPDIDASISLYNGLNINPQGSGNHTSINGITFGANLSGDNTGVTGIQVNGAIGDDVTNYTGMSISPSATGTVTNVLGINVDNSLLTSPNQKSGITINDGRLQVGSNYNTSVLSAGLGGIGVQNLLGGTFTVANGSPVTGGGAMIGNNLAIVTDFQDDMPIDLTGGLIGFTGVGFVGQTQIAAGKTVHTMNMALGGGGVPATSGGGTLNYANMFTAAGFLNQGGTIDVDTEMRGFFAHSNLCSMSSGECFGIKVDGTAQAQFAYGVELATSAAQPACSATNRGQLWVIQGGAGVSDQYEICQKDSADVYSWLDVGSGALSDYLYKPGLAGGQTATGGTGASDNLVLRSTTNGTKGQVYLDETTASTSPTTGALRVDGGVGVGGQLSAAGAVRSDTSLILSDPGAGTNTVTLQAGVVSSSYSVTLPLAQATAGQQALVNDGTGVTSWQSLTPQLFGTRQTGRSIVAGTGITAAASHMSTTVFKQLIFVVGASGGTDITASPQIEAGTIIGQEMELCGTSDADWVLLETDNNLRLNGQAELRKDMCLTLVWRGTDGTNAAWGEKARTF